MGPVAAPAQGAPRVTLAERAMAYAVALFMLAFIELDKVLDRLERRRARRARE